nr:PREDICTED: uncharacterized protein LOC109042046 [Bemisia tabaci]
MFFGKWRPRGAKPKMVCVYLVFCAVIFLLHLHESLAGKHTQKERDRTNNPCQLISMKKLKGSRNSRCQEDCEKMAKEWSNYKSTVKQHYRKKYDANIDAQVDEDLHDSSCADFTLGSCKYATCTCSHSNPPEKVSTHHEKVPTHHEKVPTHHEEVPTHHEEVPTGHVIHISSHLKDCRTRAKIFAEEFLKIEKIQL